MSRFTLPKHDRLCRDQEFKYFFAHAKKQFGCRLDLFYSRHARDTRRVAFVCGRKAGNAVVRNRCKRVLREIYRLHQHSIGSEFDLVFIGKRPLFESSYADIQKEFLQLLQSRDLVV